LATGSTRWREGAVAKTFEVAPTDHRIALHEDLAMTAFYCPASGALLAVDVHERKTAPKHDIDLDIQALQNNKQ
jgi:N-methylhydantoinase B